MSGIFGVVSQGNCTEDLFYGTDYHSHLGTRRGGLATFDVLEAIHARLRHAGSFTTIVEVQLPKVCHSFEMSQPSVANRRPREVEGLERRE